MPLRFPKPLIINVIRKQQSHWPSQHSGVAPGLSIHLVHTVTFFYRMGPARETTHAPLCSAERVRVTLSCHNYAYTPPITRMKAIITCVVIMHPTMLYIVTGAIYGAVRGIICSIHHTHSAMPCESVCPCSPLLLLLFGN